VINSWANALFAVNSTANVALIQAAGLSCSLNSDGDFTVSTTAATVTVTIELVVQIGGLLQVNSAGTTLAFTRSGTFTGVTEIAAATSVVSLSGSFIMAWTAVVQGAGTWLVVSGTVDSSASYTLSGLVLVTGGKLSCSAPLGIASAVLQVNGTGMVYFLGPSVSFLVNAIVLQSGGQILVQEGSLVRVAGYVQVLGGTLVVSGEMIVVGVFTQTSGIVDGVGYLTVLVSCLTAQAYHWNLSFPC
jgi:hypothetical protein